MVPSSIILTCLFNFLFKKWIGPIGIYYTSITVLSLNVLTFYILFINVYVNGFYFFIDLGFCFKLTEVIGVRLVFCLDELAIICSLLVLLLGILAQTFGIEYMYREAFAGRLLYLLNMFISSVVFLFLVYDFFLIILCWELIGLFSFLLVNFYSQRIYTIKASFKTFLFSRVSDLFIFVALLLVVLVFESTDLSVIFLKTPFFLFHFVKIGFIYVHFLHLLAFCVVVSGGIKGAQFFTHVWLPDAMEAPTPASALIHSSTLVIMGVYLILRFTIIFEFAILVNYFTAVWGALTIAYGALTASFQTDMKKLVAYSTISQIGYLFCGCGFCCYEEVLLYLIVHAVNKAFLFIIVGYTVHFFAANTDFRQMGGIYLYSLDIAVFFLITSFNLAGLPYSSGFFSKEFFVFQILRDGILCFVVRSCWFISFLFTPYYMFLLSYNVTVNFKKSTLFVYTSLYTKQLRGLDRSPTRNVNNLTNSLHQQLSLFSSRSTSLVLLMFWVGFIFSGEYLLLITSNFSSVNGVVDGNFFNNINYSFSTSLDNLNFSLVSNLLYYIVLFSTFAILKVLLLRVFNLSAVFKYMFFFDSLFILVCLIG